MRFIVDNECLKNPKKFLFFKYFGEHDLEFKDIQGWGAKDWYRWEVTAKCKRCGVHLRSFGLEEAELVKAGLEIPENRRY